MPKWTSMISCAVLLATSAPPVQAQSPATRLYRNTLTPISDPQPLLADYPEFVQPVEESRRFQAPILIDDDDDDMAVRAWRFSYNARGIIELPSRLRARDTAVIVVHPWGVDDGQGWRTPQPAGAVDFCTEDKNHLAGRHTREVIDPLLKRLRGRVGLVMYSLFCEEQPVHRKLYRSIRRRPTDEQRREGAAELAAILNGFEYTGQPLPDALTLSDASPVADYFRQLPGLDATARYNHEGFWDLPVPVTRDIEVHPDDVVIYDPDGYPALRDFLHEQGIRHVLLAGYATDMCYCRTTAGYQNLSQDFNVFLVGDATLATFPANATPRYATNAHISFASIDHLITQCSWIELE